MYREALREMWYMINLYLILNEGWHFSSADTFCDAWLSSVKRMKLEAGLYREKYILWSILPVHAVMI